MQTTLTCQVFTYVQGYVRSKILSSWIATTEYDRLGDWQTTDTYFSQILGLRGPEQGTYRFRVWCEPTWFTGGRVLTRQRGEGALWVSSTRALIPLMRTPPSWPNHLPKALTPNTMTLGVRFQYVNLGVGGTFTL